MEEADIKKQQELTWLENLQKNSWEPEVIISGISLAFLFVIPARLLEFSIVLIQDYGLEHLPATLVLWYFSIIISVFKIFLITHLFLRFMWAGMLGITYAFPEGVLKNKLFKNSQYIEYPHPNEYLLKLERWCSMAYGFPLSVVIPIFFISVYLSLLIAIYLIFQLDFQIVYITFILTSVGLLVGTVLFKKSGIKSFIGKSMTGTIAAVYQSHLGKWTILACTLALGIVAIPFIISDQKGFSHYQLVTNLDEEHYNWPEQSRYFEEYNTNQARFPRIWTEAKIVTSDRLNLYIPRYARDERDLPRLQKLIAGDFDTLKWGKLEKVEDTYQIFLNDSLVKSEKWTPMASGITGQKALLGSIPLAHLASGVHEVRVERLIYVAPFLGLGNEPRQRKRWARFVFVKI